MRCGRDRQRQRGCQCIERVITRDPGQIEYFQRSRPPVRRAGPPEKTRTMSVAEEREDDIAARIDVVNCNEQFAEAGLSKVVGQQLDIPPREIVRRGGCNRCGAADQIP